MSYLCVCVFVCVTCGVLLCDERLTADRLGARYPTGDTDQAALQVWRKRGHKWWRLRLCVCGCVTVSHKRNKKQICREITVMKLYDQVWPFHLCYAKYWIYIFFTTHTKKIQDNLSKNQHKKERRRLQQVIVRITTLQPTRPVLIKMTGQ